MRGFLVVTTITLVAIGVIRGVTVSLVAHVPTDAAFALTALNIVVALVWLPVTVLAMRTIDARISERERALALIALGVASIVIEPWLAVVFRYAGAPTTPFNSTFSPA